MNTNIMVFLFKSPCIIYNSFICAVFDLPEYINELCEIRDDNM